MAPWLRGLGWGLAAGLLLSLSPGPSSRAAAQGSAAGTDASKSTTKPATTKSAAKAPAKSTAKKTSVPPAPPAKVANVGNSRQVDATDIQRAAHSLAQDPLRKKSATAWRRMLLERVVDRELLALEAERRGLGRDSVLAKRIAEREYMILLRQIHEKVLVPGLMPTDEQLAEIRDEGLHRGVDLHYLILRDSPAGANRPMALRILQAAKSGASFDSLVMIYSGHPPSKAARGHFGWVLARDLEPASHEELRRAKPGDVLGVYSGPYGHEIYKIGAFSEPTDDSLRTLIYQERKRGISRDYDRELLRKYDFKLDSTQVRAVIFAAGSETPDSILASLGPDGTRPERGVRPALGILATCDGDSVTFDEVIRATPPVLGRTGRMRIRDAETLHRLCARVVLPGLTVRDARDRGLDRDPNVARAIRLTRDRILTEAMVERSQASLPGEGELRSYFEKNIERYERPRTAVARVAVFSERDSAEALLSLARSRGGLSDTLLVSRGLVERPGARARDLAPKTFVATALSVSEGDSLARATAAAAAGAFLPITRVAQGYAVAQVVSVEGARPMTFQEASASVRRDWLDESENRWVEEQLVALRAKTAVRVFPGRLESVKLASALTSAGGSNP